MTELIPRHDSFSELMPKGTNRQHADHRDGRTRLSEASVATLASAPHTVHPTMSFSRGVAGQPLPSQAQDEPAVDAAAASKEQLMKELKEHKDLNDEELIDADEFKNMKAETLQKLKTCYSKAASKDQLPQILRELKAMKDNKLIDEDEFKDMKADILQKRKGYQ